MKNILLALFSTIVLGQTATSAAAAALPSCTLFNAAVTVSSVTAFDLSAQVNSSTFNSSLSASSNITVGGTYNLSVSLCAPTVANATRANTLQVLVHGITYNKTYWSGLKTPPQSINGSTYSWVDYFTSQGYYTLSVDRLCNGNSSLPDGATVCELPVETETMHQLTLQARAGTLFPGTKAFSNVVYVGHSYGSVLGNYYLNKYPRDNNATILTAFSAFIPISFPGTTIGASPVPARFVSSRYANYPLTYLAIPTEAKARQLFYHGSYNPAIPPLDYSGTGTITLGEFLTNAVGLGVSPNIKIPVFLMNGENDVISCSFTPLGPAIGPPGQCGGGDTGLTSLSRVLFPNSIFSYFNVPNTGHDVNLHYTAPTAFAAAQRFLDGAGF